ncbi:unnamed protein product, partial [Allacma fusca]
GSDPPKVITFLKERTLGRGVNIGSIPTFSHMIYNQQNTDTNTNSRATLLSHSLT